jgi:hypothetical protein
MMLIIQIRSLIYSFLYGMFFSLLLNLNYRYIYNKKMIIKIMVTFLFIIDNVLLYFLILKHINSGIIHFYFILMVIAGYCLANRKTNALKKIDF